MIADRRRIRGNGRPGHQIGADDVDLDDAPEQRLHLGAVLVSGVMRSRPALLTSTSMSPTAVDGLPDGCGIGDVGDMALAGESVGFRR